MNETKITKKNIEEIEIQFNEWKFYLNNIIGILAFNLALSCLGTNSPATNGIFSYCFLFAVYFSGKDGKFPRLINELRKKKCRTKEEEILLLGSQAQHLSLRSILKNYLVFTMGYSFLGFVVLSKWISKFFPSINGYL